VDEDSITGSIHTVLALYWSRELDKKHLVAVQSSKRGGRLILDLLDQGTVEISGRAYVAIEGRIRLPL
jgi:predicted PhzF superfamily epimerase YddE/YHI9